MKMKWLLSFLAGILVVQPGLAMTNLIVIGNGNTQSDHVYSNQSAPWQANIIPLAILVVGIIHLFYPRVAWWFKWGWRFSGSAEPSALWLFFERLGGLLIIVLSALLFFAINGVHFIPK